MELVQRIVGENTSKKDDEQDGGIYTIQMPLAKAALRSQVAL